MYKVFIQDKPVVISSSEPPSDFHGTRVESASYHDLSEDIPSGGLWLVSWDVEAAFQSLFASYRKAVAAGGVVLNREGELLLIQRFGKWDLPKGHVEEGERLEEAAVREVEEETGVSGLSLTGKKFITHHTYILEGMDIIKPTHWFSMVCDKQQLQPQGEEDITAAEWVEMDLALERLSQSYASLADLALDLSRASLT